MFSGIKHIDIVVPPLPPSVSRIFHLLKWKLSPHSIETPHPLSLQPLLTTILRSVAMNFTTLVASYKWNHIAFVFLILAYFS